MELRDDVGDTRELEDSAYRGASDEAAALDRHKHHARRGIFGRNVVRDGRILREAHLDHMLLGVTHRLVDGERGVAGLTESDAHLALAIADDYRHREVEAAAAGHHARY